MKNEDLIIHNNGTETMSDEGENGSNNENSNK